MFAGLDVGSLMTKAVIYHQEQILSYSIIKSGTSPHQAAVRALNLALEKAGIQQEELLYIVGTGYGRISLDFANETVTELTCHALGANFLRKDVRTVIDIGGQDSKVIKIDEKGNMVDFSMNDKCAAGTGRFLEVLSKALEVPLDETAEYSLKSTEPCKINNTCTVFAETEVISLLATGKRKEDIIAGIHLGIASRTGNMAKNMGLQKEVIFLGGVARNKGVRRYLEQYLNVQFVQIKENPQIAGALGAAVHANKQYNNRRN